MNSTVLEADRPGKTLVALHLHLRQCIWPPVSGQGVHVRSRVSRDMHANNRERHIRAGTSAESSCVLPLLVR